MSQYSIAYFINQYPKVSHSFIRREILALEQQGFDVLRISLRGWDADLVDGRDKLERDRTKYVLQTGILGLASSVVSTFLKSPYRLIIATLTALKMGVRSDRPWPYHLIYLAEACKTLAWMSEFGAKHVHAHFGTNSTEVIMLAHLLGGPTYSFTVHGPEEFDKPEFIKLRQKIEHSAFVVAISSYGRSQLYRWIDFSQWHKVKIVRCGLEKAFYDVPAVVVPTAPRLVCIGRLCEQKGQLLLINACHLLHQKGVDFHLVLAGDGEMRHDIEVLIKQYGLEKKVLITGWISSDQVRDELVNSKALVLPSFAEGLPVVIMEAMALRRPVISTYIAGIPELVRTGIDGLLFPAGDVVELANVLENFLSLSDLKITEMGNSAHSRVIEYHSIEKEAAKLGELFKSATI